MFKPTEWKYLVIRLSNEVSYSNFQQRTLSSVVYLGQLYNYNVCNSTTVLKVGIATD